MGKLCTKCKSEKPLDQFCKQSKTTDGLSYHCKSCRTLSYNSWKSKNLELYKKYQDLYRKENSQKSKEYKQIWYSKNRERLRIKGDLWKQANPDYDKIRYLENREYYISKALKRHKGILQTFPAWANKDKIKHIYLRCESISKETGIMHHVDHIIPLNGKRVSGLHVETNLRIIPAKENLQKQSKFIEELL